MIKHGNRNFHLLGYCGSMSVLWICFTLDGLKCNLNSFGICGKIALFHGGHCCGGGCYFWTCHIYHLLSKIQYWVDMCLRSYWAWFKNVTFLLIPLPYHIWVREGRYLFIECDFLI